MKAIKRLRQSLAARAESRAAAIARREAYFAALATSLKATAPKRQVRT